MDALSSAPGVLAELVLNAVNEISSSISLFLPQVLALTEVVISRLLVVLHALLHDDGLGELFLLPLGLQSQSSSVQNLLLGIAESVVVRVESPAVVSVLLLARSEVHVSLSVKSLGVRVDLRSSGWEDHIFGTFEPTRRQ